MAYSQIPNLPAAISLNGTEELEAVQAGTSVRTTTGQIASLAGPAPTVLLNVPPGTVLGRFVGAGTGIAQNLLIAVDASGNVGIGTSSPSSLLTVQGAGSSPYPKIVVNNSTAASGSEITLQSGYLFSTNNNLEINSGYYSSGGIADKPIVFSTGNSTERMRITSAGNVSIGWSANTGAKLEVYGSETTGVYDGAIEVYGSDFPYMAAYSASAEYYGGGFNLSKSRGTRSSPTIVSSGDEIGYFFWQGYDGSAYQTLGSVYAKADGTPGSSDMPGALVFATTPDGSTIDTERMRITRDGNVGIGTSSPVNKLQVVGSFGRGAPVTKTADFTLADTENWVINNKSGSSCTVTLPAALSWTGREVMFKTIQAQTLVSASSNVVPLAGGSAGTAILAGTAGAWATLVSDGTNWVIMAGN